MSFYFVFRELWGSRKQLWLSLISLSFAIAGLFVLANLQDRIKDMITADGRAALGGDIQIRSPRPLSEEELIKLSALLPDSSKRTRVTTFSTMLRSPETGRSRFVRLDAVGKSYPLMGEFFTEPPHAMPRLDSDEAFVILPEAVLDELELNLGQEIFIGEKSFKVLASLQGRSGAFSGFGSFAPRVYIYEKFLESTKLFDQPGRVSYQVLFQLPSANEPVEELIEDMKRVLDDPFVAVRSFEESNRAFQRIYSQFELFAYLVILAGFLLASFALHSTLQSWFQERHYLVAILRCLGASRAQMRAFWFFSVIVIASLASLFGLVLGSVANIFLEPLLARWIPFQPQIFGEPTIYLMVFGVAVIVHAVLATSEMSGVDALKPILLLRMRSEEVLKSKSSMIWGFGLIALFWFLTWIFLNDALKSFYVVGGLILFLSVSIALSRALFWGLSKLNWHSNLYFSYAKRSILRKPRRAMLNAVLLSTMSFLLTTLILVERNLQGEFQEDKKDRQSDLIVFDLGEEEKLKVDEFLKDYPSAKAYWAPWVSVRWLLHNNKEVEKINRSGFANEIQVSFVDDQLPSHDFVVDGKLWDGPYQEGVVEVSVIKGYARSRDIEIGDRLKFSLYGVEFDAKVTSLRHVRFTDFRPFFRFVFQDGFFEGLPYSFLASIETSSSEERSQIFQNFVRKFPNFSMIDLSEVRFDLRNLIHKMVMALIVILSFLIILSLVLMGAFARSRVHEKRFELAIMKSFGASSSQLSGFLGLEFFLLAALSVIFGFASGILAANLILQEFFGLYDLIVPIWLWLLIPGLVGMVMLVSMLYSKSLYQIKAKILLSDN